jgi:anti-sigma B factor antagonist
MHEDVFTVELRRDGPTSVVYVRGEVDIAVAEQLWGVLEDGFVAGGRLVIDLKDTTFMDASGLNVLARAYHHAGRLKEAIVLRQPSPMLLRTLKVAGMEELVTIEPMNLG